MSDELRKETGAQRGSRHQDSDAEKIRERMGRIGHKVLILSGKGGVGKSTVAVNLAMTLFTEGKRVGLMDADIHGPSISEILRVKGRPAGRADGTIFPVEYERNFKVISTAFFLRNSDEAVIWRGPLKMTLIKQFLRDVDWGELDFLIIDSPPGTGDEPLSVAQLVGQADGAIIVTTPQEVALADVRRCINFCREVGVSVLGVIENMSGFICPECGHRTDIFKAGGGERMARMLGIRFLGKIPIEPDIVEACDSGEPYVKRFRASETAKIFAEISEMLFPSECLSQQGRRSAK